MRREQFAAHQFYTTDPWWSRLEFTESARPGSARILRHALATLAYRGSKVLSNAPDGFGSFSLGSGSRSAGAVLAHIGDLLDWALARSMGNQEWHLQGPIADALTHIGQIAMRRLAGAPIKGESYFAAEILIGRV